jgi:hypothetical protein
VWAYKGLSSLSLGIQNGKQSMMTPRRTTSNLTVVLERAHMKYPQREKDSSTVLIPVHGRGGVLRGYFLVDVQDADLNGSSWHFAGSGGYPSRGRNADYAHRLILERKLGRSLEFYEEAHHLNEDVLDDRRANLVPKVKGQHQTDHRWGQEGIVEVAR